MRSIWWVWPAKASQAWMENCSFSGASAFNVTAIAAIDLISILKVIKASQVVMEHLNNNLLRPIPVIVNLLSLTNYFTMALLIQDL